MSEALPVHVRRERPGDEAAIARVNDAAFGQPDESRLVDAVRRAGQATISLVASDEGGIIGHILFAPVRLDSPGPRTAMLGLGPFGLRCVYPVPEEAFMAMELVPGALAGRAGLVRYLPAFGGASG